MYLLIINSFLSLERNECSVRNGGCSHACENTKTSYQCICPFGYMLSDDQHNCKPGNIESYLIIHKSVISTIFYISIYSVSRVQIKPFVRRLLGRNKK